MIQTPSGNSIFPVSVSIPDPATAYVLVNSAFGYYGSLVGSLVFRDSAGDTYTDNLVEGTNVRDHFWNTFNNVATDARYTFWFPTGTPPTQYDSVRLDEYAVALPSSFYSYTLTSITLNGIDAGPQGQPFLAAATIASVPEPSIWAMMLAGFAGLGFAGHRASRKAAALAA